MIKELEEGGRKKERVGLSSGWPDEALVVLVEKAPAKGSSPFPPNHLLPEVVSEDCKEAVEIGLGMGLTR